MHGNYIIIDGSKDLRKLSECAEQHSSLTVRELIELLEYCDPDVPVFYRRRENGVRTYSEVIPVILSVSSQEGL